ncbi:MAG: hypothetical protein IIC22_01260 [Chloroflexi bacterium]|nr:hypothetical protein [Chloroflexota bacterium]
MTPGDPDDGLLFIDPFLARSLQQTAASGGFLAGTPGDRTPPTHAGTGVAGADGAAAGRAVAAAGWPGTAGATSSSAELQAAATNAITAITAMVSRGNFLVRVLLIRTSFDRYVFY